MHFLAENAAPVADVIPSAHGRLVECVEADGEAVYVSLFEYAKGMLLADNGYRYREGAPLSEYFYNTGKTLGAIHRLSRLYTPLHPRTDYFDKYNMTCLNRLIPDECCEREGEEPDYEEIEDAARCLIGSIPYAGFGGN